MGPRIYSAHRGRCKILWKCRRLFEGLTYGQQSFISDKELNKEKIPVCGTNFKGDTFIDPLRDGNLAATINSILNMASNQGDGEGVAIVELPMGRGSISLNLSYMTPPGLPFFESRGKASTWRNRADTMGQRSFRRLSHPCELKSWWQGE